MTSAEPGLTWTLLDSSTWPAGFASIRRYVAYRCLDALGVLAAR